MQRGKRDRPGLRCGSSAHGRRPPRVQLRRCQGEGKEVLLFEVDGSNRRGTMVCMHCAGAGLRLTLSHVCFASSLSASQPPKAASPPSSFHLPVMAFNDMQRLRSYPARPLSATPKNSTE